MASRQIIFGLHLDHQRPSEARNVLGDSILGPVGLLSLLETQLGLVVPRVSRAERIVQFLDCLQKLDSDARFYHASLTVDPLGTAAHLLEWRDGWTLHGWDGYFSEAAPKRLQELAEIEVLASTAVKPSVGQRLAAVKKALQRRKPEITQISLVDPLDRMPVRWQEVLSEFSVSRIGAPKGAGAGFLGSLQTSLNSFAIGNEVCKVAWQEDGSVLVVQAETLSLAAHWLRYRISPNESTLIVSSKGGDRLDGYFASLGFPRQGFRKASEFRPALQVLPLTLELLWAPLNFYALVQFLTHPVCPIPPYARRRLAEKVSDSPGIGGKAWEGILSDIQRHYEKFETVNIRNEIAFWIEHERYAPQKGANIEVVLERVRRLAEFFRRRLGQDDEANTRAFQEAYEQCSSFLTALKEIAAKGSTKISAHQLQKLVDDATGGGTDNKLWCAEVGAQRIATHPGAAFEPASDVIWWQLAMPVLPARLPWSSREIAALHGAGVSIPDVSISLEQSAREWLRPVMAARKRLLLVLPPPGKEIHPLWQMIKSVVDQPKVLKLEALLEAGGVEMVALTRRPLPLAKRWWKLPDEVSVPSRAKESFTSSELRVFNPYHWLLKYPAALRPSSLLAVQADFRIRGNVAHSLIERYFRTPDALNMPQGRFSSWLNETLTEILNQEGATLLMPGRGADRENFIYRIQKALAALRKQLSDAEIVKASPEFVVSGSFSGGELTGSSDLVVENAKGTLGIVDMKWSGIRKYSHKLKQNTHLQLAIYAELLRQKCGHWPSVAYFILDRASFITPDTGFFQGAKSIQSQDGGSTADLWRRFLVTWNWRTEQIEGNLFEVVLERTESMVELQPPSDALAIELLDERFNDYRALAGWEVQS